MPELPKNEEGGFVFGADALQDVVDAFGDGRFVLMSEDDDDATEVSLMMSAQHVRSEHIDFALQYARSLQVGLAPQLYDQVAGGLDQIVLDNFNLSRPALSVSAAGGGRDPRNRRVEGEGEGLPGAAAPQPPAPRHPPASSRPRRARALTPPPPLAAAATTWRRR